MDKRECNVSGSDVSGEVDNGSSYYYGSYSTRGKYNAIDLVEIC